jgi:hypothetical protein
VIYATYCAYGQNTFDDPWTVDNYDIGNEVWSVKNVKEPWKTKKVHIEDSSEWYAPPDRSVNRWDSFQSRHIAEGVWMSTADPTLQTTLNRLVDAFAAAEPPHLDISLFQFQHYTSTEIIHEFRPRNTPEYCKPDQVSARLRNRVRHFRTIGSKQRLELRPRNRQRAWHK